MVDIGYGNQLSYGEDNNPVGNIRWLGGALDELLDEAFPPNVQNVLDNLRDEANNIALVEGAEYKSAVHKKGKSNFMPGGYIYTANYKARIDEAYHGTLLQILGMANGITRASRPYTAPRTPQLPAGYNKTVGKNGRTYYHGYRADGSYGFLSNPFS